MNASAEGRQSAWPLIGHFAFAAVFVALMALITWVVMPQLVDGALRDTDDYTRLVRVRQLVETGGWFDGSVPRSNWPNGETLHWTRPLDIVILAIAAAGSPIGFERAMFLAAVLVPPLLLLGICYTIGGSAAALFGRVACWFAMIAVFAQPAIRTSYPGRVDHHVLLLLLSAGALALTLRALADPDERRLTYLARAVSGAGL